MLKQIRKYYKELLLTIAVLLFLLFASCALVMINSYSKGLADQAKDSAKLHSEYFSDLLQSGTDRFIEDADKIAMDMPADESQIAEYCNALLHREDALSVSFCRLVNDGKTYYTNGALYDGKEADAVSKMISGDTVTVSGIFHDTEAKKRVIAVYTPVPEQTCYDGVILFYDYRDLLKQLNVDTDRAFLEVLSVACTDDGEIFSVLRQDGFDLQKQENNIFENLRRLTSDKELIDSLRQGVADAEVFLFSISGDQYILSFDTVDHSNGALYTASIYRAEEIYSDGYLLVNTVYSIIIILTVLVLALLLYIVVTHFGALRKIDEFNTTDPLLNCPTYKKFEADADQILLQNKGTRFALVYIKITHFAFIEEKFGQKAAENCLKFVAGIFQKSLTRNELFCRSDNEDFALLFHYRKQADLCNRVNTLLTVIHNHPQFAEKGLSLRVSAGVYFSEAEGKSISIQKQFSNAVFAHGSKAAKLAGHVRIYDKNLRQTLLHDDEIEAKMEYALQNGEFRVLYQPKYSMEKDHIDGAEALLRWYYEDGHTVYAPSDFIPIFEANGFITTLDHFVFTQVCRYLKEAIQQGQTIVPISVNVSRVTLTQPDFPDFYIRTKQEYGIDDGFLTIEFTESFAYDSYDQMHAWVLQLRQNGFRCSVDDFGVGYSSFGVLKSLHMDELKLDMSFLQKGISTEHDNIVLRSVITMAKELGMTVTQEGVETVADLERLRSYGCDMIQGYLFSKPLTQVDYQLFLSAPEDHTLQKK